jgi:hypothetical protein
MREHPVAFLVVLALVGIGLAYWGLRVEVSLWHECRASGHSFWYCERILR